MIPSLSDSNADFRRIIRPMSSAPTRYRLSSSFSLFSNDFARACSRSNSEIIEFSRLCLRPPQPRNETNSLKFLEKSSRPCQEHGVINVEVRPLLDWIRQRRVR